MLPPLGAAVGSGVASKLRIRKPHAPGAGSSPAAFQGAKAAAGRRLTLLEVCLTCRQCSAVCAIENFGELRRCGAETPRICSGCGFCATRSVANKTARAQKT